MGVVDFEDWARPALVLTFKGKTYQVKPPTVADAQKILAAAVLGELNLGLIKGDVPDVVREKLDGLAPDDHFALGADVYAEMAADGVPAVTIDRMSYYAVFYWARGRDYADALAALMWAPEIAAEAAAEAVKPSPKARRSSPPKSGPSTG